VPDEPIKPDIDEVAEFNEWLREKARKEAVPPPRDFATFLVADHNKGRTHEELSKLLAELTAAVLDTKKAGTLTLKLKVTPSPNVEGMVVVTDDVTVTKPQHDRPASMFYASKTGQLSKDHPDQQTMFSIQGEQTR
jgi:hypothetical protein